MSCTCHKCGGDYKVDLLVDDSLWVEIKPDIGKDPHSGMMCPKCIIGAIEDMGYSAWKLTKI